MNPMLFLIKPSQALLNPVAALHDLLYIYGSGYSRMDQVKSVEDSLYRRYHFKFFKGCLPQILLAPFLNTLTQITCLGIVCSLPIDLWYDWANAAF